MDLERRKVYMDTSAKWRANDKERNKKRKEAGGLGDIKEVI